MWQLFAFASICTAAFAETIDKSAFVRNRTVDDLSSTFWRVAIVAIMMFMVGYAGLMGTLILTFTFPIIFIGIASAVQSVAYTRILRRVEIVEIGAFMYLAPFAFLIIDTHVLHTQFEMQEVLGIIFLILGGIGFALDGITHRFSKQLTIPVLGLFMVTGIFSGLQAYLFKYLHANSDLSVLNFFASYTIVAAIALFAYILYRGKVNTLWNAPARGYVPHAIASKAFDTANNLFWAQALTLATVSQVGAMQAMNPLIVFIAAVIAQGVFHIKLKEQLDRRRFAWKAIMAIILVIGGILVS